MSTPTTTATKPGLSPRKKARYFRYAQYGLVAVAVAVLAATIQWDTIGKAFFSTEVLAEGDYSGLFAALGKTLLYTVLGFGAALSTGLVLALMRLSSVGPYRWAATLYVEFFRGVPALLVFIAFAFGLPLALGVRFPLLITVTVALGLVGSAYVAETIRAGIQAVPPGQVEAARSLGMNSFQTMVFVVIPQAFKIVLPPLTNELILLTEDSSLIYIVGLTTSEYELTKFGKEWMNSSSSLTPIILVGLCYLIITVPLGIVVRRLERQGSGAR